MEFRVDPFYAVGNTKTKVQPTCKADARGIHGIRSHTRNGPDLYWEGAVKETEYVVLM